MSTKGFHWALAWVVPVFGAALLAPALVRADPTPPSESTAAANQRCLQCHAQPHIGELSPEERLSMVGTWLGAEPPPAGEPGPSHALRGDEPATRPGLYLPPGTLSNSVHPDLRCVDCHVDADRLPHAPSLNTQTCASSCHSAEYEAYFSGSHHEALEHNDPLAPTCASCHGGHDILHIGDRQSPEHRLNSIFLCADCHEHHMRDTPGGYKPRSHIEAYLKSAHGKAVVESGLVAAPTCTDCHAAHAVHPVSDDRSPVHRDKIPKTCGGCHVGILSIYETSIHGKLAGQGDERAPVCTDCHTAHEIVEPDQVAFKLKSGKRCGACHEDRIEHYQETFHGRRWRSDDRVSPRATTATGTTTSSPSPTPRAGSTATTNSRPASSATQRRAACSPTTSPTPTTPTARTTRSCTGRSCS